MPPAAKKRPAQEVFRELVQAVQSPQRLAQIDKKVSALVDANGLSASTASRLKAQIFDTAAHEIKLKWPTSPSLVKLYSSKSPKDIQPLEIAVALVEQGYLCYQAALYWNELSEQVPRTFYVAKERPKNSSRSPAPPKWDDALLRDAFTKPPIEHKKVAVFQDYKFVVLERSYTGGAGVIEKSVPAGGTEVKIRITGLERTLVDCAAMPENAGGIGNVIDAFENAKERIDLSKLIELYKKQEFKYPHWQRIAFLLEHFVDPELAQSWRKQFGKPMNRFYLAKGYRLDWKLDERNLVFYPPGVLK